MEIVVACGGTGGHAFPGLAVAEELARRSHPVTIWSSGRDVESSVLRTWGGEIFATGAKQLSPKNAFGIVRSIFRCRGRMKKRPPAVLLAMGSYSSLPPVLAAKAYGVPVVLHEANSVPGRAVDCLSRYAAKVAISFKGAAKYFPQGKTVLTGLPVRNGIADGKRFPEIPEGAFTVFVTGGSQGAHAVNLVMMDALSMLKAELDSRPSARPLYVIHQTGEKDVGVVMAAYAKAGIPSRVNAFEREMANAFASADIVVARAGASTCFELAAAGKPAFLIPLPTALRNHQFLNAEEFSSHGAADVGIQARLTPESAFRYLLAKYERPDSLAKMSEQMRTMQTGDAAARLADVVEATANVR